MNPVFCFASALPRLGLIVLAFGALSRLVASEPVFEFAPVMAQHGGDSYVGSSGAGADFARNATLEHAEGMPYLCENRFSDREALSPATGYTGPRFFGGYVFSSTAFGPETFVERVQRASLFKINGMDTYGNAIRISARRSPDWYGTRAELAGVIVFKQSEFSGPFREGSVRLDGFSARVAQWGGISPYEGRWVVQKGGKYYVSSPAFDFPLNGTKENSVSDEVLAKLSWSVYHPEERLRFDENSAVSSPLRLEGITAVGIYFSGNMGNHRNPHAFSWELGQFSVFGSK